MMMMSTRSIGVALGMALAVLMGLGLATPAAAQVEQATEVTFTKDIAPILQRSCQNCHQPDSVAPMTLITYEQVRPWARAMKRRTGMGPVAGVMPPWYVERDIGIQHFQTDPSLSLDEIAKIAMWADNGAPRGNPADMPPPKPLRGSVWTAGEPDLITVTEDIIMKGDAPDWWGEIDTVSVGQDEDRYVKSVEIREINDVLDATVDVNSRETVGGRFVWHHLIWSTQVATGVNDNGDPTFENTEIRTGWPVHEVGRNPDFFDAKAGRLLPANSWVVSNSIHLHSNGRDTKSHLEIGWRFFPKGYEPTYRAARRGLGNGIDISIVPNLKGQELHAYNVLSTHVKITDFEPHLHAPGGRMCLEAIWGHNVETLNCVGYDHNWVRVYEYAPGYEPLLPKGTILHIIGYMDNTTGNRNIPDPRNWQGSGNRSVANMFLDLGDGLVLSDEQFAEEMAQRREMHKLTRNDHFIGCPLCAAIPLTEAELAQQAVAEAELALAEAERALTAAEGEGAEEAAADAQASGGQE